MITVALYSCSVCNAGHRAISANFAKSLARSAPPHLSYEETCTICGLYEYKFFMPPHIAPSHYEIRLGLVVTRLEYGPVTWRDWTLSSEYSKLVLEARNLRRRGDLIPFVQRCLQNLDDEGPRLVFADYLDERELLPLTLAYLRRQPSENKR